MRVFSDIYLLWRLRLGHVSAHCRRQRAHFPWRKTNYPNLVLSSFIIAFRAAFRFVLWATHSNFDIFAVRLLCCFQSRMCRGSSILQRSAESISQSQRHWKRKRKLYPKIGCLEIVFLHFKYVIKAGLRHYKHQFKAAKMLLHSCCHARLFSCSISRPFSFTLFHSADTFSVALQESTYNKTSEQYAKDENKMLLLFFIRFIELSCRLHAIWWMKKKRIRHLHSLT